MSGARTAGMAGLNPLTYEAIAAWAALTGARPSPWEVETLRRMDLSWMTAQAKRAKSGTVGSSSVDARDGKAVSEFMRAQAARPLRS